MRWPWQEQKIEPTLSTSVSAIRRREERQTRAVALRQSEPDAVPTDLAIRVPRTFQDKLTEEQQQFILQNLSQFRSYFEIQQGMQEHFHFTIDRQSIDHYAHAAKWRIPLREARLKYLTKTMSVPIANQVVRMERYEKLFQECLSYKDRQGALAYLRAAGEEMGRINKKGDVDIYVHQEIAYYDRIQCEKQLVDMEQTVQQQGVSDGTSTRVSEARAVVSNGG